MMKRLQNLKFHTWGIAGGVLLAALALGLGIRLASAGRLTVQEAQISPLHPTFALLDTDGANVLESGSPVSTMKTCGKCHDTAFIASHSFHVDLGMSDIQAGNSDAGRWDPLTYRYLLPPAGSRSGAADWLRQNTDRVVGGGPGAVAQLVEMDCFLCHTPNPNNAARVEALAAGEFGMANTATLFGTGIVAVGEDGMLAWNTAAFDADGELLADYVAIQAPANDNCAQCHGLVHTGSDPLVVTSCSLDNPQTAVTGQVISGDKISESGVNLSGKSALARPWDIHAERGLACVDCHYSLNNPIAYQESAATKPEGLVFDPRRLDFGEYLKYPDHNFARGESAQYNVAPELKGTMRRCESCHDAQAIHADWLPYIDTHMSTVACETCHIPQMYAPAIQAYDWTVLTLDDTAASSCRGVEGIGGSVTDLVTGFQPVLMMRKNVDGDTLIAPYNLITTWYWIYDDAQGNTRPVRLVDLEAVYFAGGQYASKIMDAFDYDGDGALSETELRIDTADKQALIAARLAALGLGNPRIVGEIQPYSINHNVAGAGYAISACRACHADGSRLSQSMQLADYVPGGVTPEFVDDTNVTASGTVYQSGAALYYQPDPAADKLYIFGYSRYGWVDWLGGLFFLGTLVGVVGHGTLRYILARRRGKPTVETKPVYMYEAYERFWHWLQTSAIVVLLLTGLIIHRPDLFGGLSFRGLVVIHNVLAALLAINALLSIFWHFISGEIQQYIPHPYGFIDQAIVQAKYYIQGVFRHEPHPFNKTKDRKFNPLQKITYLGLLAVLFPLQGITGILMWGAQQWPQYAKFLGGLPVLAAFHTLVAWLFATFIIGHVYLTTTGGPKALDSIKAMVTGWEDVEVHEAVETPQKKK
ncbi:MAG: Thiosulfate reductase cytochrome B subunit (Membrane anchoring protein) [Anaerolineaceae bacterium]|nr:MAG: Thiosulfate reductase cytochrome B subunit (Membrane anchoring protein) [Anaerolineaceae bacterium]